LAQGLPSACPTPRYKEIRVSTKIRPHPSGTLSKTLDLKISPQEVVGVLVWSTNSLTTTVSLLITPTTVERVVAECTSLIHVGRLQPSNSITSICSRLVVQAEVVQLPTIVQQLTRFRLTHRVARSVCGSRASCCLGMRNLVLFYH